MVWYLKILAAALESDMIFAVQGKKWSNTSITATFSTPYKNEHDDVDGNGDDDYTDNGDDDVDADDDDGNNNHEDSKDDCGVGGDGGACDCS